GLDRALARRAVGELANLVAHLDPQELDGLVHVAAALLERALAVHHARAGALAQLLDVGGGDRGARHAFCSWLSGVFAEAVSGSCVSVTPGAAFGPPAGISAAAASGSTGATGAATASGVSSTAGCASASAVVVWVSAPTSLAG